MSTEASTWSGRTASMAQTVALGEAVAGQLVAGDLVALVGELGAGKTQFVRGLANGMGITRDVVVSPTFVIAQEYHPDPAESDGPAQSVRPRLIHIDAYRIHKLDELESIGYEITGDILGGELRDNSVIAIEWADRLDELVGSDHLEVRLFHTGGQGGDERRVEIEAHGKWRTRMAGVVSAVEKVVGEGRAGGAEGAGGAGGTGGTGGAKPRAAGKCAICGKPVNVEDETFPFCSKRCRTIDLGKWISGNYVISRPIDQSDLEEV